MYLELCWIWTDVGHYVSIWTEKRWKLNAKRTHQLCFSYFHLSFYCPLSLVFIVKAIRGIRTYTNTTVDAVVLSWLRHHHSFIAEVMIIIDWPLMVGGVLLCVNLDKKEVCVHLAINVYVYSPLVFHSASGKGKASQDRFATLRKSRASDNRRLWTKRRERRRRMCSSWAWAGGAYEVSLQ